MDHHYRKTIVPFIISGQLFILLSVPVCISGQPKDTSRNNPQILRADSPHINSSQQIMQVGEVARSLVVQNQYFILSYGQRKIKHRIEKDAPVFQLPTGESRVVLLELPHFVRDYTLTIRSLMHGIGFTYRMFAPVAVFLDSSFRQTHLVGEKKFLLLDPRSSKRLRLETTIIIDEYRKSYKYLLVYTPNNSERIGTYADTQQGLIIALLKHPVVRSPDGKLELELHLR